MASAPQKHGAAGITLGLTSAFLSLAGYLLFGPFSPAIFTPFLSLTLAVLAATLGAWRILVVSFIWGGGLVLQVFVLGLGGIGQSNAYLAILITGFVCAAILSFEYLWRRWAN